MALSVFGLGLMSIASFSTKVLNDNSSALELQTVSLLADRHIAEIEIALEAGESVQREGVYSVAGQSRRFPWVLNVTELQLADLAPTISVPTTKVKPLRVDLAVSLEQGSRQLTLHSLVLARPSTNLPADAPMEGSL